jgi:tetratricopeptide (TPR) repeat protein
MLKPLLFILTIVILIALVLNFDLFSDSKTIEAPIEQSIEKLEMALELKPHTKKELVVPIESNLTKELQSILYTAYELDKKGKRTEALLLYEEVIEKSKNSQEVKILKLFAKACFQKAIVHYSYPSYDTDSAIESYELIIHKFKDKYDKKLLILYMEAKLTKAQFMLKEEIIITYDELIEKFENDKEKRFEKEIENMLYSKSFALMGIDDEEAIEVLDSIIAKYKDKNDLPDTVKYSILNNIELSIITANDTDKYVDLANQYMADSPDTKPLLDMLSIIKNAQNLEQSEALEQWNEEHNAYDFPDWDFSELRKWTNKMETPESQKRIREYLDIFEKQKYKKIYQTPAATVPTSPVYSDEATPNSYPTPSSPFIENTLPEEVSYEEVPEYEPNPYLSDILEGQNPTIYPDPYAATPNNSPVGGVSHTYDAANDNY